MCDCADLRLELSDLHRRYRMLLAKRSLVGSFPLASGAWLDPARCEVRHGDQTVRLPYGQWRLLEQLATEGRQDIRAQAKTYYGHAARAEVTALRVLASRLRKTLRPIGADSDIVTTGSGYVLDHQPPARPAAGGRRE